MPDIRPVETPTNTVSDNPPAPAAYRPPVLPQVRSVTGADIRAALAAGLADFRRAPLFGLFFGGAFAAGGLAIFTVLTQAGAIWMIIPLAIGFPLIGPFAAVGLYEVSRRLAADRPLRWREILTVVIAQRHRQLSWMAFVVLLIFWIWIYQIRLLVALFLGFRSFSSLDALIDVVTTTPEGLMFLAVGTAVGAGLSFVLFASNVIALPLLLDTELDFVTAMILSFRTVLSNPVPMLAWGVTAAALTLAAMLPAFLGLAVVMPVLGHATWHLYTRAIAPAPV